MSSFAAATNATQKAIINWKPASEMLNIYLPRVSTDHNKEELQYFLREIALVEEVDFVAIKQEETKLVRYYAVYMKLKEWNANSRAYQEMIANKTFKLHISPVEYLILLPNKTPLPRSKVNTHQLASFTEELFNKVAVLESHCAIQAGMINSQSQQLHLQAQQINWLMKMSTFKKDESSDVEEEEEAADVVKRFTFEGTKYLRSKSTGVIYNMEQYVIGQWNEDTQKIDFEEEGEEEFDDFECEKCKRKFDDGKQLDFHETVCLKEEKDGKDEEDYSSNEKCIQRLKTLTTSSDHQEKKEEKADVVVVVPLTKVPWQLGTNGICGNL
jgi:hypothetical protein